MARLTFEEAVFKVSKTYNYDVEKSLELARSIEGEDSFWFYRSPGKLIEVKRDGTIKRHRGEWDLKENVPTLQLKWYQKIYVKLMVRKLRKRYGNRKTRQLKSR